nr:winged helix-turn-helix domain-containing protein [Paraburkholderia aspalathi]
MLRPTRPVIVFGRYRLTQDPLRLTADGAPVAVGARALALLSALVEADGRPVSFAALANRIWGRPNVEINSVQVQVSALRRALGEDRDLIATMAGFGYRFVGSAKNLESQSGAPAASEPAPTYPLSAALGIPNPSTACVPLRCTPFIGRYAELSELLGLMSTARAITLVGAPGLGKTRLAHEVARRVVTHFPDGIGSVALSPQMPPDGLIRTLALAMRIELAHDWSTPEQLAAAIGARRLLLIIDCCGPLRASLGGLIERLVSVAPALQVIVTATAPLSIRREQVVAVGPLGAPDYRDIRIEEALAFDACRLLLTRLAVLRDTYQHKLGQRSLADATLFAAFDLGGLAPDAVSMAALITRRLSGAPLALELAASAIARRMDDRAPLEAALLAFANKLEERMARRAGRADTALSPEAAIATVVELLHDEFDNDTRAQLRWLGIFSGEFTRDAAIGMFAQIAPPLDDSNADTAQTHARCEARLDDLLSAGLVERIEGKGAAVLRLPGPVRLFASDALALTNELGRAAAAHARSLAARLSTDLRHGVCAAGDERDRVELELDELRAALKWSVFNDRFEIAIALIEASAPLWRVLSPVPEYLRMIRIVLTRVSASASLRTREEMRLWKALANELLLTQAPRHETTAAWRKVYELASACADNAYRRHALAGLIECLPEAWEMSRTGGHAPPTRGSRNLL